MFGFKGWLWHYHTLLTGLYRVKCTTMYYSTKGYGGNPQVSLTLSSKDQDAIVVPPMLPSPIRYPLPGFPDGTLAVAYEEFPEIFRDFVQDVDAPERVPEGTQWYASTRSLVTFNNLEFHGLRTVFDTMEEAQFLFLSAKAIEANLGIPGERARGCTPDGSIAELVGFLISTFRRHAVFEVGAGA